jgi:hypothetical protein
MAFEIQQQSEVALSLKFRNMVAELHKEWESEETKRAQLLEEKLRAHYSAMIEHMEAQLQMALRVQVLPVVSCFSPESTKIKVWSLYCIG